MSFTTTSEWREGRRDGGTEGGNGSISVMKVRIPVSLSYVVCLCACVRSCVRACVCAAVNEDT